MGYAGTSRLRSIRETTIDFVDRFINDFLTVNPRSTSNLPNIEPYLDPPATSEKEVDFDLSEPSPKTSPVAKKPSNNPFADLPDASPKSAKAKQKNDPFVATYVGGDSIPEITITNKSNHTLTLNLGMHQFHITPNSTQKTVIKRRLVRL